MTDIHISIGETDYAILDQPKRCSVDRMLLEIPVDNEGMELEDPGVRNGNLAVMSNTPSGEGDTQLWTADITKKTSTVGDKEGDIRLTSKDVEVVIKGGQLVDNKDDMQCEVSCDTIYLIYLCLQSIY